MSLLWLACVTAVVSSPAAQDQDSALAALERRLQYRQGSVVIGGDLATLAIPETFRYLGPAQASEVLQAWGNPPRQTLGMIVPARVSPLHPDGWGVIVTFEEDGYVKDDDAASIDYDDLLKQMQRAGRKENKEREKAGYPALELIGWAETPHYDKASHQVYWAKELAIGTDPEHTLNYNIRVLGRRGVLVLNAVALMRQWDDVLVGMDEVRTFTQFNAGHRYTDFTPGSDHVAEYGIAALVAGGIAAKTGLLKALLAFLVAGKKLIVVAVVALAVGLKKLLSRQPRQA